MMIGDKKIKCYFAQVKIDEIKNYKFKQFRLSFSGYLYHEEKVNFLYIAEHSFCIVQEGRVHLAFSPKKGCGGFGMFLRRACCIWHAIYTRTGCCAKLGV
jgi:hypothetical protein